MHSKKSVHYQPLKVKPYCSLTSKKAILNMHHKIQKTFNEHHNIKSLLEQCYHPHMIIYHNNELLNDIHHEQHIYKDATKIQFTKPKFIISDKEDYITAIYNVELYNKNTFTIIKDKYNVPIIEENIKTEDHLISTIKICTMHQLSINDKYPLITFMNTIKVNIL